jgi:hypothetical protein
VKQGADLNEIHRQGNKHNGQAYYCNLFKHKFYLKSLISAFILPVKNKGIADLKIGIQEGFVKLVIINSLSRLLIVRDLCTAQITFL